MNSTLIRWAITSVVIIGLVISTLVFYALWQTEKEKVIEAQSQAQEYKAQVEARTENKEDILHLVAEEFVNTMFSFHPEEAEDRKQKLLEITDDKAKKKLKEAEQTESFGEMNEYVDVVSSVVIKERSYQKISDTEAEVKVLFEQKLEGEAAEAKTLSEIKLVIEYIDKEWLITDFAVTPMI